MSEFASATCMSQEDESCVARGRREKASRKKKTYEIVLGDRCIRMRYARGVLGMGASVSAGAGASASASAGSGV